MSRNHRVMALFAVTLPFASAFADNVPYMLQDIEGLPETISSSPDEFMPLGDRVVFKASTPETGNGLWVTDGTADGTSLLRSEISVYLNGSGTPAEYGLLNGELYFGARSAAQIGAYDLWATDGTPEGTRLVREMPYSSSGSRPQWFVEHAGKLYFAELADDGTGPIWVTDGTEQGTSVFFDGNAGPLASLGDRLLFAEWRQSTGSELWTSDGTPEGTSLLTEIAPGGGSGFQSRMAMMNGYYYFLGQDSAHGRELWRTDGTIEGTTLVRDIYVGSNSGFPPPSPTPLSFAIMGDKLYFVAVSEEFGTELWRSDGTEAGTSMVVDTRPGTLSGVEFRPIAATNDHVFFRTLHPQGVAAISATDGTAEGTTIVIPFVNNAGLILSTSNVAFLAGTFNSPPALWRSDGTPDGTFLLRTGSATNLIRAGEEVAFTASDSAHGSEPWFSDGTVNGTRMVADIANTDSGNPVVLTDVAGRLYYRVTRPDVGVEPFSTLGTPETTSLVADIGPAEVGSNPSSFRAIDGGAIFSAFSSGALRLFRTDSNGSGATPVDSAPPLGELTRTPFNGFYYGSSDGNLWRTNGFDSFLVASGYSLLGTFGNQMLLAGSGASTGDALWVSDGLSVGNVIDVPAGPATYGPAEWIGELNGRAYYALPDSPVLRIYSTDGTFAGTRGVLGTETLVLLSSAAVNYRGALYLGILPEQTGATVEYLVALDGPDGPPRVILANVNVQALTVHDDLLYVIGFDQITDEGGLWVSDGTAAGTARVPNVRPDSNSALVAMDDAVYFRARDDAHGVELWRSRGSVESTALVSDLNPGPTSSNPSGLTASGERLYFSANDGVHGTELWALARNVVGDIDGDGDNDLQDLSYLLANFGGGGPTGDLDGDGDVDLQDLSTLLSNFGDSVAP